MASVSPPGLKPRSRAWRPTPVSRIFRVWRGRLTELSKKDLIYVHVHMPVSSGSRVDSKGEGEHYRRIRPYDHGPILDRVAKLVPIAWWCCVRHGGPPGVVLLRVPFSRISSMKVPLTKQYRGSRNEAKQKRKSPGLAMRPSSWPVGSESVSYVADRTKIRRYVRRQY